jgi:hypothetical protein
VRGCQSGRRVTRYVVQALIVGWYMVAIVQVAHVQHNHGSYRRTLSSPSSVDSIQQCQMGKLSTTDTFNPFQPASSHSPSLSHGQEMSLATKGSKSVLLFEGNRLSPSRTKSFQGGNERQASALPTWALPLSYQSMNQYRPSPIG